MLQRIQTIWLLLASVCAFAGLKFPFYSGTNKDGIPSSLLNGMSPVYLLMLTVTISVLALVAIFLYKNRTLQLRLCLVNILLAGRVNMVILPAVATVYWWYFCAHCSIPACGINFLIFSHRRDKKR